MRAYYNDNDPIACAWMRELIEDNLIPEGEIDGRSIKEVRPEDLEGFTQAHFFGGIGGWAYALRLAGWDPARPVWTGSCPCQPFSSAGKGKGLEDERHLWPVFFRLIGECRPATILGEQVASKLGCGWLARVRTDLESLGYAVGCADLPVACVGAPHIRQRLFWVANLHGGRCEGSPQPDGAAKEPGEPASRWEKTGGCGGAGRVRHRESAGGLANTGSFPSRDVQGPGEVVEENPQPQEGRSEADRQPRRCGEPRGVGNTYGAGLPERGGDGRVQPEALGSSQGQTIVSAGADNDARGFWSDSRIIPCRDGKYRRVPAEPALFPLAHGIPGRVGLLRGAGNSIAPQVAAAFIKAFLEAEGDLT